MTYEWIYTRVKDKLQKWSSNAGQNITERVFIDTFNEALLHWFNRRIKNKEVNQDNQESLQRYLKEVCLKPKKGKNSYLIDFPEDYFYYSRIYGNCTNGDCEHEVYANPREEGNVNSLLKDSFHKPSFSWQDTFFTLGNNKIRFYIDGFTCSDIVVVYYKCPILLTQDGDTDLVKHDLEEVIDLTVQILAGDIQDPRYNTITNHIRNEA